MTSSLWTDFARGSWPRGPAGYLFLAQAVDLIGRHLFGADWRITDPAAKLVFPRQAPRQYVPRSIASNDFSAQPSRSEFEAAAQRDFDEHNAAATEHNRVHGPAYERARSVKQAIISQAANGALHLLYKSENDGTLLPTPDSIWTLSTAFDAFRACCATDQPWMRDQDRRHPVYLFVEEAELRAINWKAVEWRPEPAPLDAPTPSPIEVQPQPQPLAPARPAVRWAEDKMTTAIKEWTQENSTRDRDVAWRDYFKGLAVEHGWDNRSFRDHWSTALGSAGQPGRPKSAQ